MDLFYHGKNGRASSLLQKKNRKAGSFIDEIAQNWINYIAALLFSLQKKEEII